MVFLIVLMGGRAFAEGGEVCKVLQVVDGDTMWVTCKGKEIQIRLLRINAPERGCPGSSQAAEALERLAPLDSKVRLEFEGRRKGKRERLLAYVWRDGLMINAELVRLGWACFRFKDGFGKYAERFRSAESEARSNNRGLSPFWPGCQ